MNETKKEKSHDRAPDQTTISVSMDRVMLARLDKAAEQTGRTRSNFIRWVLRRSLPNVAEL